ncbi:MAG: hypothetical protein D3906_05625 [Candidatus Electrothrix sp. AUS1_2]|nr:hypothetical protein [Candidatus Electrothrix sp. AUS1_2]
MRNHHHQCRSAAQYTVQGQFEFEHNDIAKKKQGFNSAVLLRQLETAKRKLLTSVDNCSNVDRVCRGGGHPSVEQKKFRKEPDPYADRSRTD